ncbi:hypothetical protein LOK46_10560 [Methylobacterium sp. NMS14P]|uniref:hypothetical protein n=1 Tax=Methylobacterium sp. NMS14P TaxID=2894310 RepID=UPI002358F9E3|nr:hypothetical protein [Methylobacterium sp. NMS14P]WCS27231.1 hypothetical protein LOK46_10560 [Methylobacterium sp. NMS14P]
MRHALACLLIALPVAAWAQGRASTNDDISNALGGTSWYPPAARPRSPADPANTGQPAKPARPASEPAEETILFIPGSDVDGACGRLSYAQSRIECVKSEQRSYELIKRMWMYATDHAKRESIRYAAPMRNGVAYYNSMESYLISFMRDDQTAREIANPPKFQR